MTIKHGFFASADPSNPTTYDQQTFAKRRSLEQTDGILEGVLSEFATRPSDPYAMSVDVTAGSINIQGYWMDSDDIETLRLATADPNNPRIDRIVVRLDTAVNMEISLAVLTGTPSSSPTVPALTRTNYIYEMALAQVHIGAAVTSINMSNLTDERRNASYCGYTRARFGSVPPGSITSYAGATIPSGWLLCDGATLNKADYPELFSAIGYIYGGAGENFQIPSLVGRMPLGKSDSLPLGQTGGAETVTLLINQVPSHKHNVGVSIASVGNHSHGLGMGGGGGNYGCVGGSSCYSPPGATNGLIHSSGEHGHGASVSESNVGNNQPHDNMPPYLALNVIIKA